MKHWNRQFLLLPFAYCSLGSAMCSYVIATLRARVRRLEQGTDSRNRCRVTIHAWRRVSPFSQNRERPGSGTAQATAWQHTQELFPSIRSKPPTDATNRTRSVSSSVSPTYEQVLGLSSPGGAALYVSTATAANLFGIQRHEASIPGETSSDASCCMASSRLQESGWKVSPRAADVNVHGKIWQHVCGESSLHL
jgi:hypothetical protein